MSKIYLETNRLIIRDHVTEDLPTMHTLLSNAKAMYYLQDLQTFSLEGSMENLRTAIEAVDEIPRTKFFLRIELKDGTYVGEIGFTVCLDTPLGKVAELGYFILPQFWGRGIATEAAAEVLRFGFDEAGLAKLEVGCIKDNVGSERVMKKLGMIKEAEYVMRVWHDGSLKDRVEYRFTKDEWQERKEGAEKNAEA